MNTTILFCLSLVLCFTYAEGALAQSKRAKTKPEKAACCSVTMTKAASLTDRSLYQVSSMWTTQHGSTMQLASLTGHVVVATMIFTTCTYACPQIIADVRAIAGELSAQMEPNVKFVFITMDVERDSSSVLHAFAQQMRVLQQNWIFLHGNADDTREIAALLGIKYKKMADGSFSHSNIISVLDVNGEIVHQQVGLNVTAEATVSAIQRAYSGSVTHE